MLNVKPHQRVNKLPGSGFVTNKVNLATTPLQHIPPAFRYSSKSLSVKELNLDVI